MTKPDQEEQREKILLYQVWKGNNRFFCCGRLIFGPDVNSVFLTTILIAGPVLTFCGQIISKMNNYTKSDHRYESSLLGYQVLIVTLITLILDLTFLFATSSKDPGIVPRNKRPPEADESFKSANLSTEWVRGRTSRARLPRTKDVLVNGVIVKVKYCDTCMLYRPPRASHCSVCNNCVQKFDHHCPWVGQCIGLRNYRTFSLFISTSTFLCIYVFTLSWLNIFEEKKYHKHSFLKSMTAEVISLVLIVYTFIAVWFVGGLTLFHFYLISRNQTTYENFRYRYEKKDNPYNQGVLRNFRDLFFSRIPPSMNNFRSKVIEEAIQIVSHDSHVEMGVRSAKDKIDIEMGGKFELDENGEEVPRMLQESDYSSMPNDLNLKDRQEDDEFHPFTFSVNEEGDHGPNCSTESHEGESRHNLDKSDS